ncbi:WD40 repeat domain-containing protein [Candidatus Dependentiae bacterium]
MKNVKVALVFVALLFLIGTERILLAMKKIEKGQRLKTKLVELLDRFEIKEVIRLNGCCNNKSISKCGNYVASVFEKGIVVFDIKNKKVKCSYKHKGYISDLMFNHDGNYIMSGTHLQIKIYDIRNKKEIWVYDSPTGNCALGLFNRQGYFKVFSPEFLIFDLKRNKKIQLSNRDDLLAFPEKVENYNREFFPIDSYYYKRFLDSRKVIIYNKFNKKKKCSYEHDDALSWGKISNDNRYILSSSCSGEVIIYDIKKEKQRCAYKHKDLVFFGYISQDNNYAITGCKDGQIIIYDMKNNEVKQYWHDDNLAVGAGHVSKDGDHITSVSEGGHVIICKTSPNFYYSNIICKNKKKQNMFFRRNLKKMGKNFSDVKVLLKK